MLNHIRLRLAKQYLFLMNSSLATNSVVSSKILMTERLVMALSDCELKLLNYKAINFSSKFEREMYKRFD